MRLFIVRYKNAYLVIIIFLLIYFITKWQQEKIFKLKFISPKKSIFNLDFKGPRNSYQRKVVIEFLHAWKNYKKYAWGRDELKPVSKGWINWMGFGLTIIDSLDTLHIMGLHREFVDARKWVASNLSFNIDSKVSTFEVTIRVLGGLLSAYHFTADNIFLFKAIELGNLIHDCIYHYKTSFCPCRSISFVNKGFYNEGYIPLAEMASIQIEMRDLSRITGDSKYEDAAFSISKHLHKSEKIDGMLRNMFSTETGKQVEGAAYNFGSLSDSYYEYLLKQWIQTSGQYSWLATDFKEAIEGAFGHLLHYTHSKKNIYFGSRIGRKNIFDNSMESLSCFLPGTLALAVKHGFNPTLSTAKHGITNFKDLAIQLGETCYYILNSTSLHLMPEHVIFPFSNSSDIEIENAKYMQRPEIIESFFYLYHMTNDSTYRDRAWRMFKSIVRRTKVRKGYAGVENANVNPSSRIDKVQHIDKMESFFLAETLKYFYFIFDDDFHSLPLTSFIFNTEAHILPIYKSTI